MKRHTPELKEQRIQAGIKEIRKHGIDQLSLRTIAKSCGVTHGTPYRHFENKETYLKVVLKRLSVFLNHELMRKIITTVSAKDQLTQMGFNLIHFAKSYPYYFEALFIKFPFKYVQITKETIAPVSELPVFSAFKRMIFELRKEEAFCNSEAETLIHFWSFASGLAIISKSTIGKDMDDNALHATIKHMLDIYIKGEHQS